MQPNRVWIAVLLAMFFAVSLTITAEAQESGTPNDAVWRRADELLKKLTLDEKIQLILSKYPSNASRSSSTSCGRESARSFATVFATGYRNDFK
jgi:hypothetical protein